MRALLVSALFVLAFAVPAFAVGLEEEEAAPQQILIGLDLSKSNPLVEDPAYAARVARRLGEEISALPVRSRVMVRTFGVYDASSNPLKIDQVISARARPEEVASGIETLVANLPRLVEEGKLSSQMMTYISAFLGTMSQSLDCGAMPTRVILLTDGAEDSDLVKLKRSGTSMPAPDTALYQGCDELVMLGLGQGFNDPATTERFRETWGAWAEAAGFKRFTGLYDW